MKSIYSHIVCRITAVILLLAVATDGVTAKRIEPNEAHRIATDFINQNSTRGVHAQRLQLAWDSSALPATTRQSLSSTTFYVFEAEGGDGFVIVAADDCVRPILGYSYSAAAPKPHDMPQNLISWLGYVDKCVTIGRANNAPTHSEWGTPMSEGQSVVLETAHWGQDDPYNRQCPLVGNERCLTGCTATASAIIMYYYQWPNQVNGTAPAYTTSTGLEVASRNVSHTYKWDKMLDKYSENNFNEENANAVATLMADLGHIYQAEYGVSSTGAVPDMTWLIYTYKYNPGMNFFYREGHTQEAWEGLMRSEIDAGRPIAYNGYDENYSNGHAFVVDGYNSNGYFHVNWGWSGSANGYFQLDNLLITDYDFNYMQWIVTGYEPYKKSGDFANWLNIISNIVDSGDYRDGVPFVMPSVEIYNHTHIVFDGYLRIAHTDQYGNIKSWVSDEVPLRIDAGSTNRLQDVECLISDQIEYKDRLRIFYRDAGEQWYLLMPYNSGNYAWEIELEPPLKSIGESTSISFDKVAQQLRIEHDYRAKVKIKYLGSSVAGVIYEQMATLVNTEKLTNKKLTIDIELGNEKRSIELNIKNM